LLLFKYPNQTEGNDVTVAVSSAKSNLETMLWLGAVSSAKSDVAATMWFLIFRRPNQTQMQ
jgi:hypothetical protein